MKRSQEDQDSMEALIAVMFHDGSWFRFPEAFLWFTGHMEAILLAFLIKHCIRVKSKTSKYPLRKWFFCKVTTLQTRINFNEQMQTRYLKRLKEQGFIQMERRGLPSQRYIKLDINAIVTALNFADNQRTVDIDEED